MKHSEYKHYVAAGFTAFCVVAGAIFLFFLLLHVSSIWGLLKTLSHILRPIFMGMILAFLLLPIHRGILKVLTSMTANDKLKDHRNVRFLNLVAIIFSLLLALILIYLLLVMVVPQVYWSIVGLVNAFPDYIASMQVWLRTFWENNPEIETSIMPIYSSAAASLEQWLRSDILPNLESVTSTFGWLRESIWPNLTGMVSNVSAMVVSLFALVKDLLIALIVSIYLLARKDIFAAQSKKIVYSILPPKAGDVVVEETREAYRIMSGFINGKLLDSLIIGIITLVCCNLFKFPYPALVATVIGVTNIIPFFGPFIGAIPCALLILFVNPLQCLYFVAFILVLQQFDGNILGPKILGDSTGLASFWVLFSILLFGGLFGFAGMVLGVPVFAMIYSVIRRLVNVGLRHHKLPTQTEYYIGVTQALGSPKDQEKL